MFAAAAAAAAFDESNRVCFGSFFFENRFAICDLCYSRLIRTYILIGFYIHHNDGITTKMKRRVCMCAYEF